ncbi:uncharacterized protein BDCG_01633 [Blastomyces dermatitidis ER-3]|uniref:Uncharacterized protein n=2 Tax=Ajellomyces dermatitidis TaxID=5039 RepID=F2T785_AJEDA|nr:uncharacterized protein BDCG_01633 [Blastomyces dermatitidis ER-3]EEQ86513.2 hypothetical protein BDCG_01633 [Blastomyces dermatitidis ER-3]EGE79098.1 hypothetical protein BDDG_02036 [Blastomyces dermatitidis ATCC 18188]EQL37217.1 hypothetical protein BDFG_01478 [Blastomyces dermatitidis ATCC 26199]
MMSDVCSESLGGQDSKVETKRWWGHHSRSACYCSPKEYKERSSASGKAGRGQRWTDAIMPDNINLRGPSIYRKILHGSPSCGQALHKFHRLKWTFYRFTLSIRVRKGEISLTLKRKRILLIIPCSLLFSPGKKAELRAILLLFAAMEGTTLM